MGMCRVVPARERAVTGARAPSVLHQSARWPLKGLRRGPMKPESLAGPAHSSCPPAEHVPSAITRTHTHKAPCHATVMCNQYPGAQHWTRSIISAPGMCLPGNLLLLQGALGRRRQALHGLPPGQPPAKPCSIDMRDAGTRIASTDPVGMPGHDKLHDECSTNKPLQCQSFR